MGRHLPKLFFRFRQRERLQYGRLPVALFPISEKDLKFVTRTIPYRFQ